MTEDEKTVAVVAEHRLNDLADWVRALERLGDLNDDQIERLAARCRTSGPRKR